MTVRSSPPDRRSLLARLGSIGLIALCMAAVFLPRPAASYMSWNYGNEPPLSDFSQRDLKLYNDLFAAYKACRRDRFDFLLRNLQLLADILQKRTLEAQNDVIAGLSASGRGEAAILRALQKQRDTAGAGTSATEYGAAYQDYGIATSQIAEFKAFSWKHCQPPQSQTAGPPPAPPPGPPPPPVPPVSPTHRTTNCPQCQGLADRLNAAADNYAEAVRRRDPDQAVFRQQMAELSLRLDDCERQCAPQPQPQHGMLAPPLDGTGFYVGLNAGGATGSSMWHEPFPAGSTDRFGLGGGLGGGTVGWQGWSGPIMFGIESDIAGGNIGGDTDKGCITPCRTGSDWLATVRGLAGYNIGPVTPYLTGGLAIGDVNAHVGAFPGGSTIQAGWTAGGGLQFPLSTVFAGLPDGVKGKIEYLRVDLGSPHLCTPPTCGGNADVEFNANVFRFVVSIPLSTLVAPPSR